MKCKKAVNASEAENVLRFGLRDEVARKFRPLRAHARVSWQVRLRAIIADGCTNCERKLAVIFGRPIADDTGIVVARQNTTSVAVAGGRYACQQAVASAIGQALGVAKRTA